MKLFGRWFGGAGSSSGRPQTFAEFLDVTPEEDAAVARHFNYVNEIARVSEGEPGELSVRKDLYPWLIAQGLWEYAEELVRFEELPARGGDVEKFNRAATALLKSLKLAVVPLVVYRAGVMLDAVGSPEAIPMLRRFLQLRDKISMTPAQQAIVDALRWDEEASVEDAKRRLGSHP